MESKLELGETVTGHPGPPDQPPVAGGEVGSATGWRGGVVDAAIFALFVLLSVLMTWPLADNLGRAVSDPGDPLLNTWIMEWTWHSLTSDPSAFWHAPVFYPARYTIAFSENLLGITIPLLPLYAARLDPLVIYNVALLLGFAWSGFGAFVLGRLMTGSRLAGIVGGIFFAFMPYRFDHVTQLQHVWSGWIPLALAALLWFGRSPSWKRALLLGGALLINGLSNGHWLLFSAVAIGLGAILLALLSSRMFDRRFWVPLVVVVGVTHGGIYLFLQPYREVVRLYEMERNLGEAAAYSAEPSDWLSAGHYNRLHGGKPTWNRAERSLFPGALVLLLGGMGVLLLRREDLPAIGASTTGGGAAETSTRLRPFLLSLDLAAIASFLAMMAGFAEGGVEQTAAWKASALPAVVLVAVAFLRLWLAYPRAWGGPEKSLGQYVRASRWNPELWVAALWVTIGYLGSLGMNSFFHQFLFSTLSPFRSIRVPARWAMISYVGLAALAAVGTIALLSRTTGRRRVAIFAGLSLVLLLELRAAPIRWFFFDAATPPVYEWLATAPFQGAILETPIDDTRSEFAYMFRSMSHHRPVLNGFSGYETKRHLAIKAALREDPIPADFIESLEKDGCGILVVHNEDFRTPESVRAWLRAEIDSGRLRFVRRFDHGVGGDYVFALTSVETGVEALRAESRPDGAGRTHDDNARIFLEENGKTWNGTTFGWIDRPGHADEVKGPLVVSGWALSPHGVDEVRVAFGNARVAMTADRFAWHRLSEVYPWYPGNDRPGFRLAFPDRPDEVSLRTDVLVEIVDGNGDVTHLDHRFLTWHPRKPIRGEGLDFEKLAALSSEIGLDPTDCETIRRGDPEPLVAAVLSRNESLSDAAFLESVYSLLLDRTPEKDARDYYLTRLLKGGTRRDVVEATLNAAEFRKRLDRRVVTAP